MFSDVSDRMLKSDVSDMIWRDTGPSSSPDVEQPHPVSLQRNTIMRNSISPSHSGNYIKPILNFSTIYCIYK